jgi:putative hydrolase of HD superfamily
MRIQPSTVWRIALLAVSMARVLELKVDVTRVVEMLLVHDLGEIDAGDKFVFASAKKADAGWKTA